MIYNSTRDKSLTADGLQAVLEGLAPDGGLYIPSGIGEGHFDWQECIRKDFTGMAEMLLRHFFPEYGEELSGMVQRAYAGKFDSPDITPLVSVGEDYCLELFRGPTSAFKDIALSILPELIVKARAITGKEGDLTVLTATSGDTGKAALEGFKDVEGTKILVFYPEEGVSRVQKAQMQSQEGSNVKVCAVKGNFDDCQSAVKKMFNDARLKEQIGSRNCQFSSANSINIGRLVPQMVYYVYAYTRLVARGDIKAGDKINVVVPTGNFGNILAAYYAKEMGLPIARFICASNENKVLYDFFETGIYNKNREFVLTNSPSMDILISSNLERLIHLSCGMDSAQNLELMNDLAWDGSYQITDEMKKNLKDFYGGFASQEETCLKIREMYDKTGYVMDTHTAVAKCVYDKYVNETGDNTKTIIASTASPFKFTRSVMSAIDSKYDSMDDFTLVDELSSIGGLKIPQAIEDIRNADIRHNNKCKIEEMEEAVVSFLQ